MPDDKPTKKADKAPLVSADVHQLAAQRQTLQMNRDLIDPQLSPEAAKAKKDELAEIDRQIAEIDKQLGV